MLSTYPPPLGNQNNKMEAEEHNLTRNEFDLMMIQKGSNSYSELMLLIIFYLYFKCSFYFFHIPKTFSFSPKNAEHALYSKDNAIQ